MESSLFSEFVPSTQPPAAYIGGKRRLAPVICRAIDRVPHRTYCEVFLGMGGIFFRRTRVPTVEIVNDWSEDVSTLFRILQRHYVAFLDMLRFQLTTRAGFERLLNVDPSTQTDLERAARFLYLQRLAYGGKVAGRSFGVDPTSAAGFDVSKLGPLLEAIHERLSSVTIERLPWQDFIARYDREDALFYLDPPYFLSESDYGSDLFGREQFSKMVEVLAAVRGRFLLSLNDHETVREMFGRFAMGTLNVRYSISGGEGVECKEVLISNLDGDELDRVLR